MSQAKVMPELIEVIASQRSDADPMHGARFLTVNVPNDWEDVRKICKKVLEYDGRYYTFTGWNSDSHKCYFRESTMIAKKRNASSIRG